MRSALVTALGLGLATALTAPLATAAPRVDRGGAVVFEAGRHRLYAGTPASLEPRARALHGDPKARAVLRALQPEIARKSGGIELVQTAHERFGDGDQILTYGQVYRGLPVVGFSATVRLDSRGDAVFSSVELATDLSERIPTTAPAVTPAEAAAAVAKTYRVHVLPTDAYLAVANTWEGPRLVYAVLPSMPLASGARPRFLVDASDGAVIEARDTRAFVSAQVYPANPEKTPATQLLPFPMDPSGDRLTNPFLTTLNCIDKKEVKDLSISGFSLKAHVCTLEQRAAPNAEGAYVYLPKDMPDPGAAEDEYAEVSMYYHASRAYEYFRALQGVPDAQIAADKPLRTIANLRLASGLQTGDLAAAANPNRPLDPYQNAFFSPKSGGLGDVFAQVYGFNDGAMWFGQGPRRDYAYDGDVVYHEFTHAVVDNSLKLESWTIDPRGASAAPGAMNEALADYFSSALAGDPDVGEYAAKDFSEGARVIRSLENTDTCDNAIVGEVHYDSTLFSGALWDARVKLPPSDRQALDAAIYKSMRTNAGRGRVSYMDLAKMFLATIAVDLPAAKPLLEAAFTARGVLPLCGRVRTAAGAGKPVDAPQGFASPGLFIAPGKPSLGQRDLAPGIVQVKIAVPAKALKATLSFAVEDRGGGGPGGGKPFAPVVFVKFDAPITWTATGKLAHDGELTLPLGVGANQATFELPASAKEIYAQIGNSGDQDGYYGAVRFKFELPPAPVVPPKPPPAPLGPEATSADGPGSPASAGCAAAELSPSSASRGGAAALGVSLGLGFVAARRRRRRA